MKVNKPFGDYLSKTNYLNLRSLAQKLSYKAFNAATGFGSGIHYRLRKFPTFEGYKRYTKENSDKYYPRQAKKAITLRDVYAEILEVKKILLGKIAK